MRRQDTFAAKGAPAGGDAQPTIAAVTLRYAVFDDAPDLFRLAQLDSAAPLREPILVAEVAGRTTAALSLSENRVIADPFVLTASTVALLRARARQLRGPERPLRRWRLGRARALRRAGAL
ncbi:MAG TPA: hypothetical protein VMF14_22460 [Solirubrobacteraceae bacterium]|nr:hypothetical protein [Solirubrobacteraceae bacterium]